MADVDPLATQRDLVPDISVELCQAGFDNVEEIGHGGFGSSTAAPSPRWTAPLPSRYWRPTRYAIGARIKAAQGDHDSAVDRLAAGAKAADHLGLPRLAARINNERIRLGIELPQAVAAGLRSPRTIPRDNGIATLTAELDEDSAIRLLSASDSADDREQACRRAAELAVSVDGERRPLAALQAQLLLIETLTAVGRATEARNKLAPVAAKCAELGLSRLLVDAGLAWPALRDYRSHATDLESSIRQRRGALSWWPAGRAHAVSKLPMVWAPVMTSGMSTGESTSIMSAMRVR
jgi:hypothetical protein